MKVAEWLLWMVACTLPMFGIWFALPINHASTGALLTFQGLQAIALFIVPSLAVAYLWSNEPLRWLGMYSRKSKVESQKSDTSWSLVGLSIAIIVLFIPLINCLVAWNQSVRLPESMQGIEQLMRQMEEQADALLQSFLTYQNGAWWVLVLNLLILAVLPAIGEELTFRGVLQGLLSKRPLAISHSPQAANDQKAQATSHLAVWLTAAVFSFVHFQFYGFVARLLLGVVLGYALIWSGRIGYSMLMHATNNALSVLVFYLCTYVWHVPQQELEAIGSGDTWWLTVVCTPVACVLLYLFHKRCRTTASA